MPRIMGGRRARAWRIEQSVGKTCSMNGGTSTTAKRRGRPHRYLLSAITVCGVCGAPTRIGTQNTGAPRGAGAGEPPSRYTVYECAGAPGSTGFHVSMHQEHLDRIVTDAVLARIGEPDFRAPPVLSEDEDGEIRRALRLEIKSDRAWLDAVQKEAARSKRPHVLIQQQRIVLPRIQAAETRIEELDELDPLVLELKDAQSARNAWERMPLAQRRHVVQVLVVPRIRPIDAEGRGRRGVNAERVDLEWRRQD